MVYVWLTACKLPIRYLGTRLSISEKPAPFTVQGRHTLNEVFPFNRESHTSVALICSSTLATSYFCGSEPYSHTIYDISWASDWSRWPSRPIRSLRYIVTCMRIRANVMFQYSVTQIHTAVTAYLKSKQSLLFVFAVLCILHQSV